MSKTLVVVESPAKAKTIKKYLGSKYEVLASKGHVKDLPKKMGIDIEHGFEETYEVIVGKEKVLAELKDAAADADHVLLATDPDREGEAIAWHLAEELGGKKKKPKRVEFHEITKKGVQHGVDHPRELDKNLYDAQRARRVLDRIVGYDVSALVWSKLAFGLSAGRVQSVALRLIVDREREIEAFQPVEYWNCGAWLQPADGTRGSFFSRLTQKDGKKATISTEAEAKALRSDLEGAKYKVAKITKSERKRNAPPPYTTSKLQQDAVNRLGFSAKRTMQVAQGLYEGVDLGKELGSVGLITYMRTDSVRSSPEAVAAVREWVTGKYGKEFLPPEPNQFKSKKSAQEAHEAIRPSSLEYPPDSIRKHLKDEQFKLYKMIWDRFAASQMKEALYDQTGVDVEAKAAKNAVYTLRSGGRVLKFAGWLAAYESESKGDGKVELAGEGDAPNGDANGAAENGAQAIARETAAAAAESEEDAMIELAEGEALVLAKDQKSAVKTEENNAGFPIVTEQKFTQPPPRYNEGSLVRELEERGIGRPSTYAEIISKVQARDYVEKLEGRFHPTTLGKYVVDGLVKSDLDFMDPAFTSGMEEQLDGVEAGDTKRVDLLTTFYKKFRMQLDKSKKGARWNPEPEHTGEICTNCGPNSKADPPDEKLKALPPGEMMKRWSKNGWFVGCSNYPKCKNTRDMGPDGKGAPPPRETGIICDKCGKPMSIRSGRYGEFLSCTGYPACKNAKPVPLGVPCPKCGGDIIEVRSKKRGGRSFFGCSNWNVEGVKCDFKLWQKPVLEPCPVCNAPFLVYGGSKNKPMLVCADKECGYKRSADEPSPNAPPPAEGAAAAAQPPAE
jgi:DNA topoisomerase-1